MKVKRTAQGPAATDDYELAGTDNNYAASFVVKRSDERVASKLDGIVALESAGEVRAALKE